MPAIQKTWVRFKQFFRKSHRELRETFDLTVEDASIHHTNMVRDVVAELQEILQQDQAQTETLKVVQVPVDYVSTAMQNTQQQFAAQLQQMQVMMQAM